MRAQALQQALEGEYNASQMGAMCSGLDGSPIVLIQVCPSACMRINHLWNKNASVNLRQPYCIKAQVNASIRQVTAF